MSDDTARSTRERLNAAIRVESAWVRAAVGGVSAVVGVPVAEAVTDPFAARVATIFVVSAPSMAVPSALANRVAG